VNNDFGILRFENASEASEEGMFAMAGRLARDIGAIWNRLEDHAGESFHQIRGGEFTYRVMGGCVVPNRTNRQLPRGDFARALESVPLRNTRLLQRLQGPSYIYAILMDHRIRRGDW